MSRCHCLSNVFSAGLFALSWVLPAQTGAQDSVPAGVPAGCKSLWVAGKVSLVFEHELCDDDSALESKYLEQLVKPKTYFVQAAKLPSETKKRMEDEFGIEFDEHEVVELFAVSRPDWVPAPTAETAKLKKQSWQGGPGFGAFLIRACNLRGADRGHYELTRRALERSEHAFPPGAAKWIADASRGPDDFEFGEPSAHAQAEVNQSRDEAEKAYHARMQGYATKLVEACRQSGWERAGYVLGYILHGVQDLSTHAGQTNPQHAYRFLASQNPDGEMTRLDRASTWTSNTLNVVVPLLPKTCFKELKRLSGSVNHALLSNELGFGTRDSDVGKLRGYIASGRRLKQDIEGGRVKQDDLASAYWFDPSIEDQLAANATFNAVRVVVEKALGPGVEASPAQLR